MIRERKTVVEVIEPGLVFWLNFAQHGRVSEIGKLTGTKEMDKLGQS